MDQGVINNLKFHYRKRIVLIKTKAIEGANLTSVNALDVLRCLQDYGDDDDDALDNIPLASLASLGEKVVEMSIPWPGQVSPKLQLI